MPRKTLRLRELVEWVNERNTTSTCEHAVRQGWNALVNSMLMAADAYAGFSYLTAGELRGNATGQSPGIVPDTTGYDRHSFPDESRIRFIVPNNL